MGSKFDACVGWTFALAVIGGILWLASYAYEGTNEQKVRTAALPQMTEVGRVATSDYNALRLREFEHPTRPGVLCLYAIGSHAGQLGLSCWKED